MPSTLRKVVEVGSSRLLGPLGYEVRDRVLSERPEGFPGYLDEARRLRMDVNDYEEQKLGWRLPEPTLQEVVYPYLTECSSVCEIGPGTGRWSRCLIPHLPQGELHLVDQSPWMARFLTRYFTRAPRVYAHVGDGLSLPFPRDGWLDIVFSANTFVALTLGVITLYVQDFARVLKPGGYAVVDYLDPGTVEGWEHLQTQPRDLATVYTFHTADVIDRVFVDAGLPILRRYQVGKSTFVVACKSEPIA